MNLDGKIDLKGILICSKSIEIWNITDLFETEVLFRYVIYLILKKYNIYLFVNMKL